MPKKKTPPEPRPDATKPDQFDMLRNFECALPLTHFLKGPKKPIKSVKVNSVKVKAQRSPRGSGKTIQ